MKPSSNPPTKSVDSPWTASTSLSFQHETRQQKGRKLTFVRLTFSVQVVKPLFSWVTRKVKQKGAVVILVVAVTTKAIGIPTDWVPHLDLILWSAGIGTILIPDQKT